MIIKILSSSQKKRATNGALNENHHSGCSYFDGFNERCENKSKKKIRIAWYWLMLLMGKDEGAISLLKNYGVEVYVDWMDDGMPKTTSGHTAVKIKERIRDNHKFIFLATEGAINSKWCNWELGHGDADKYIEHIALLPVKRDYTDFSGNEYLEIYPYIFNIESFQYFKGDYRYEGTYIIYPSLNGNDKVIPIAQWLRNR